MGILADEPGKETLLKAFHGKVVKVIYEGKLVKLPVVKEVSKEAVEEQFRRVKREVVEWWKMNIAGCWEIRRWGAKYLTLLCQIRKLNWFSSGILRNGCFSRIGECKLICVKGYLNGESQI